MNQVTFVAGNLMHHNLVYKKQKTVNKRERREPQKPGETGSTPSILSSCVVLILTKYSKVTIKSHKFGNKAHKDEPLLSLGQEALQVYSDEIGRTLQDHSGISNDHSR